MALKLENINVIYSGGTTFEKHALNNINIEFPEGKVTGIIGHTGSGKSTLAQLLNGIMKPSSGRVMLDNIDIWENPKELRSVRFRVGMVFQYPEYQLFEETVAADIAFGPKNMGLSEEEQKTRVASAAAFCGIDDETLLKSPFEISGGQKRRAAIAGVIAMDPDILVLDEPAAGLDPSGRTEILNGLINYHRDLNKTLLLISHSMEDIASLADYILVLKNGKKFMFGTVKEIFSQSDALFESSLDLPQITKLFVELKKRGITEETDVYTLKYAKSKLCELLGQPRVL